MLTSFNALDVAQQKVLLSSKLLTEEQKSQCATMVALSSVNTKYTAEQLTRVAGVSAETLANWGLVDSTDSLTIAELAELAVSDKQAKNVLEKIVAQNAQAVVNGEVTASNIALASSEGGVTLATGAFTTAIKANIKAMTTWMISNPVGWLMLLAGAIGTVVGLYDLLTTSIEEQREKMEESLSAYEDAKSELSSITTELKNQEQAMDELIAKEKLTYAEKGQLEELQAITKELRIQKNLAQKEENRTKEQLAKDSSDLFNKQFGNYEISEDAILKFESANLLPATMILDHSDISQMIAGYKEFNELLDEAYGSESQEDIDYYKSMIKDIGDTVFATATELQKQQSNISAYYETIKNIPYENLTPEQQEIVDSYNAISNAIRLIYQQLDPNSWNSMQVDSIFSNEGIEKTKKELVEMAKSGELTPDVIKGYTNLNKALSETTLSAEGLCEEMYAIAEEEDKIQDSISDITLDINIDSTNAISSLKDLRDELENLDTAMQTFSEEGKFDLGDLDSVADYFLRLENVDTSILNSVNEALNTLMDTTSTAEQQASAIDTLADSYMRTSGVLDTITESNAELVKTQLEHMGVVNAEEVVNARLAQTYLETSGVLDTLTEQNKHLVIAKLEELGVSNAQIIVDDALAQTKANLVKVEETLATISKTVTDVTYEEILALINEKKATGETAAELARLALEKISVNNVQINTSADIANIYNLAQAAGATATQLRVLANAKSVLAAAEHDSSVMRSQGYKDAKDLVESIENGTYQWDIETPKSNYEAPKIEIPKVDYGTSGNMQKYFDELKDGSKSAKKEFEETVDFFEERIEELNNALDLLKVNLENVVGSFAKNKLIDAQIGINKESINNYSDALDMYTEKANEALSKLPSDIAEKVKNGAVALDTFIGSGNESVVEAIKEYDKWSDAIHECRIAIAELEKTIETLELNKFSNIIEDFNNQFDIRENSKDLLDKQIDLFKEAGLLVGTSLYDAQIDQSKKQLSLLEQEKAKLVEQMNSALASGRVKLCPAT